MKKSRFKITKNVLLFWCLFIGLGAMLGGVCMLIEPSGSILHMEALIDYFQVLPFADVLFQNYIFSGIALIIVNGLSNLVASTLILFKKRAGLYLGMIFGFTLMLWIIIQFVIFPPNFLSTVYFIFGVLQFLTGYMAITFYKQEIFSINEDAYTNINKNKDTLVLYFSRMGYTKKLAYEIAEAKGATIYEVKATEKIDGTLGFWWCGRFGMNKLDMGIEELNIDVKEYKNVIIVSPIWVFDVASPIRTLCKKLSGQLKNVSYVTCHYMKAEFNKVSEYLDGLLNVKHKNYKSVCCRKGKYLTKTLWKEF